MQGFPNQQTEIEEEMELRRGPWSVEEDMALANYITHHGEGRWNSVARSSGLKRTGKSCRLRWLNYLRPDVRRGNITLQEQLLILQLHSRWGNRWSKIAHHLPGRTDNEIKNYWRTRVQKHAKQLKCDVNSKQFKDTMRFLWMPRLVERIQASTNYNLQNNTTTMPNIASYTPESSSGGGAASSDALSDLTECYNNYHPVNQPSPSDFVDQSLTTPSAYFNEVWEQNNSEWMGGGDVISDNLWSADDILFFQEQFSSIV